MDGMGAPEKSKKCEERTNKSRSKVGTYSVRRLIELDSSESGKGVARLLSNQVAKFDLSGVKNGEP